jgi:hypothetical protein
MKQNNSTSTNVVSSGIPAKDFTVVAYCTILQYLTKQRSCLGLIRFAYYRLSVQYRYIVEPHILIMRRSFVRVRIKSTCKTLFPAIHQLQLWGFSLCATRDHSNLSPGIKILNRDMRILKVFGLHRAKIQRWSHKEQTQRKHTHSPNINGIYYTKQR